MERTGKVRATLIVDIFQLNGKFNGSGHVVVMAKRLKRNWAGHITTVKDGR